MEIRKGGTYYTNENFEVRIVEDSLGGNFPLLGVVLVAGVERSMKWRKSGQSEGGDSRFQIITEAPPNAREYAHKDALGRIVFKNFEDVRMKRLPWLDQPETQNG